MKEIIKFFQLFLILLLICQCAFKSHVFIVDNNKKQKRIYFKVPKKYLDKKAVYGDTLKAIGVFYNDSSMIYISERNSKFLPNYYNIKYQPQISHILNDDTSILIYSGIYDHKAWQELIYEKKFRIGYSDVPVEKIPLYDKALLKSLPKKDKSFK